MRLKAPATLLAFVGALALAGCGKAPEPAPPATPSPAVQPVADAADTIYFGDDIVTVNDAMPSAEALAVKTGKIVAVGARAEVEQAPVLQRGVRREKAVVAVTSALDLGLG